MDIKAKYGTNDQAITISPASLADGAMRESTAVDNGTNLFLDALVGGKLTTGTSPTANSTIEILAYGTVDGETIYSGDATGTDAAYSGRHQNTFLLGVISVDGTSDKSYEFGPLSVASAFGGVLPEKWGIIVRNNTGAALHATAGNHDVNYQGVLGQSA